MAEEIEYEQFEQTEEPHVGDAVDLGRVSDIPMELSVEIGRTQMTVGETLTLRAGTVVTLDRFAGEPVELLANGTPIARGEVVVVDDKFGLRIRHIVDGAESHPQEHQGQEPQSDQIEATAPGADESAPLLESTEQPVAPAPAALAPDAEVVEELAAEEEADGELAA
jgi:flagellar motor switch protein FliN/FliY